MAKQVTVRTDKDHREALDLMQEYGEADSRAEAMRASSQAELARRGYLNGSDMDTPLRKTFREFARLFSYGGFAWLGFTVMWSLEFRLAGVWLLTVGLVLFGVDRGLARVEPRVTDRINGLLTRSETA